MGVGGITNHREEALLSTYPEVQRTRQLFLMVQHAVMPTNVLPAPHGRMMIPLRARLRKRMSAIKTEIERCFFFLVFCVDSSVFQCRRKKKRHPLPNILLRLFSW
jgi:hypothetical protein